MTQGVDGFGNQALQDLFRGRQVVNGARPLARWEIREGHDFVPNATQAEMAQRTNWGRLLHPELLQPSAPGLPAASDRGPLVRPPE